MKTTRTTVIAILLVAGVSAIGTARAVILNPGPVAQTGQAISYAPGDDGELQKGVSWPDPRFTDNLDGTVTDHLTGLVWLRDATRFSNRGWNPALNACNDLGDDGVSLTDGSAAGDWRLPNSKELRRLIDFGNANPALPAGHPFVVAAGAVFWTSTTSTNNTGRAWTIDDGTMVNDPKGTANGVWPVRDGPPGALGPAPVPKTGQTISYGARDDGELQKGVAWPAPRFTDNLDGTVTDNLTGLIWLQDGTIFSGLSFAEALAVASALADDGVGLTDGSAPGDWRLPNVLELGSLTDFSQIGPALPVGHPFTTINAGTFWSSTTTATNANRAWTIGMGIGRILDVAKGQLERAWPVRGDPALLVDADIKPGSDPNSINPSLEGDVPVALLGSEHFDVADVDPATLAFGPDGASFDHSQGPHVEDVNGDGYADLVAHYRIEETGIAFGDTEACVTGALLGGRILVGCDAVRTVPDMDGDALLDVDEAAIGTDALNPDTDGDGFEDGQEVLLMGTDPLDPLDPEPDPAPEPAGWPMLVAGAALLGAAYRRRVRDGSKRARNTRRRQSASFHCL